MQCVDAGAGALYRYFANVVEEQLSKDSQVILMSHQPIWLEEWMKCTVNAVAPNLRYNLEHSFDRAALELNTAI